MAVGEPEESADTATPILIRWALAGSLRRLRWLAIVIPLAFLATLDYVRHTLFVDQLHTTGGAVFVFVLVAAAVSAFSFVIFGLIGRLERRVIAQNRRLAVLNAIAAASARNLELAELLQVALEHVLDVTEADAGVICILDTEKQELVAACHRGFSAEVVRRLQRQKLADEPIASEVVRTRCPVVIEDLFDDPRTAAAARSAGFRSGISVPLLSEGSVSGVMGVATKQRHLFARAEVELLGNIGGQLALAIRNSMLFANARQLNEELAALLAVGRASTSSLDLAALLDEALRAILEVTSAETAEVWLTHGDELRQERLRGRELESFREMTHLRIGEGFPGLAAQTGRTLETHDLASDARCVCRGIRQSGFQTYCALPLRRGSETVGVLTVAARDAAALSSPAEHRLLQGIGEQLAIAIENARLHERVLDVAVLEERERIARELHDGLAQVLGYINTQSMAVRKLLASGRTEEAGEQLRAMEDAAKLVYADVREAIVGLRASREGSNGFTTSLQTYLGHFSEMAGIRAELSVAGESPDLRLPGSVEIQLMRIIQEALSNVRKHASATRVDVRIEGTPDEVTVEVADDGRGLKAQGGQQSGWPRLGLQTMRERAQAIGGAFEIASRAGSGTTVTVRVPLQNGVEAADARPARG